MDAQAVYLFSTILSPKQNINRYLVAAITQLLVLPTPLPGSEGPSLHQSHHVPYEKDPQGIHLQHHGSAPIAVTLTPFAEQGAREQDGGNRTKSACRLQEALFKRNK